MIIGYISMWPKLLILLWTFATGINLTYSQGQCSIQWKPHRDNHGIGGRHDTNALSQSSCQLICDQSASCTSFDWDSRPDTTGCFHYSSSVGLMIYGLTGVTHYQKQAVCNTIGIGCIFKYSGLYTLTGGIDTITVNDMTACFLTCVQRFCIATAYNSQNKQCILMTSGTAVTRLASQSWEQYTRVNCVPLTTTLMPSTPPPSTKLTVKTTIPPITFTIPTTPGPVTPAPATLTPATPAPVTPAPATPAPATPAPTTAVQTTAEATPAPTFIYCTSSKIDLVMVIDGSGSICDDSVSLNNLYKCQNWLTVLQFLTSVVDRLVIGQDQDRVGLVIFGFDATIVFDLEKYHDKNAMKNAIMSLPFPDESTNTYAGLNKMREVFTPQHGDRADVANVGIIVTDGKPTEREDQTEQEAEEAQKTITMYSFGITQNINEVILQYLSSEPRKIGETYFRSPDFASISSQLDDIVRKVCEKLETTTKSGVHVNSMIETVFPLFGPVAGGTRVTIRGSDLIIPAVRVHLMAENVTLTGSVLLSAHNYVIFNTPPASETLKGLSFRIWVQFTGETRRDTTHSFMYRANPVVESIAPLKTIRTGGTFLNVFGANLDIPAETVLGLTSVVRVSTVGDDQMDVTRQFHSGKCNPLNETSLKCRLPELDLPPEGAIGSSSQVRRKRAAGDGQNTTTTSMFIYLGLIFDGYTMYENITALNTSVSDYGMIRVYVSPVFGETNQKFDYQKGEAIDIKGTELDTGVTAEDYVIHVGHDAVCEVKNVSWNVLRCLPPEYKTIGNKTSDRLYPVIVEVATLPVYHVGDIEYRSNLLIIAIVCSIVLGVLIILLGVCILCVRHRRRKREPKQFYHHDQDQDQDNGGVEGNPIYSMSYPKHARRGDDDGDDTIHLAPIMPDY